jgi:ribA/ribD-fused uncharacterized protein
MTAPITEFRGKYRFLSNFYAARVEWDGVGYPTVEHAFQAAKTTDPQARERIRGAETPGAAKAMGRRVPLRPDWDAVKVDIMRELLFKKFQDLDLAAALYATEDVPLVEGNWWGDTFWGVCQGRGENMLGKLLMEVRATLRGNGHA